MTDNIEQVRQTFEGAEEVSHDRGAPPGDEPAPSVDGPEYDPMRFDGPPRTPEEEDGNLPIEGARLPLNDTGNGKRFALYHGKDAMFVPRVGWHVWDGMRWKLDPDGIAVRRHAQQIQYRVIQEIPHLELESWQLEAIEEEPKVRARLAELKAIEAEKITTQQEIELEDLVQKQIWIRKLKDRKSSMKSDHRSFAKTTGNKGRIDAMLTEATTSLSREVEDLDADPLTVNTEAGLLRFKVDGGPGTGLSKMAYMEVEPHVQEAAVTGSDRAQYITKLMPIEYDRGATCPTFDAFLHRVQPKREMREFLQRWWGANLTGQQIQKFLFQYGKGANGKSVLSDLMGRLLGDYATTIKIESITGRNRRGGGDATPDLMPLVGARAARANEPDEGERLQEGMIKDMTGGEPILVRNLHSDFIEVRPFFKLTISGNHKPDIRGTDDGIWRRVLLVPFDVQIPENERDDKLIEKLWAERAGILNWLIDGLISYLEGGLDEPAEVLEATQEYRAESDPLGTFLDECCVVDGNPENFLTSRDLIDAFTFWQDQIDGAPWGGRQVSLKLKSLAGRYRSSATSKTFEKGKRNVTGYRGIKFTDIFKSALDAAPRNAQGRPVASSSKPANAMRDQYPT